MSRWFGICVGGVDYLFIKRAFFFFFFFFLLGGILLWRFVRSGDLIECTDTYCFRLLGCFLYFDVDLMSRGSLECIIR